MDFLNADQPIQPSNMIHILGINQGNRPLTMDNPSAKILSPSDVIDQIENDCVVLDIRSNSEFTKGHIPDAYHIEWSSKEFIQRVGRILPPDVGIVLITGKDMDVGDVLQHMALLGLDQRVSGYLAGGMDLWIKSGLQQEELSQMSVQKLGDYMEGNEDVIVLDVREPEEWDEKHIQGARHIALGSLHSQLVTLDVTDQDTIAVICASGQRSSTASSILLRNGFKNVYNVSGGMQAWSEMESQTK